MTSHFRYIRWGGTVLKIYVIRIKDNSKKLTVNFLSNDKPFILGIGGSDFLKDSND